MPYPSNPHQLGWLLIALGVGVILWALHDYVTGETRVETPFTMFGEKVSRSEDPGGFRRLIVTCIVGGVVCVGMGVGVLVLN